MEVMPWYGFSLLFIFGTPLIVFLIIGIVKSSNKRRFKKRYGYTPETFDQLKKLKQLADMGVITQEEFEAKKKQLLNL